MDDIQIGKLKRVVAEKKRLLFWVPGDGTCRQIVRVGIAPTLAGDVPEPSEVGIFDYPPGQYVALSEMSFDEFIIGKRLEEVDLELEVEEAGGGDPEGFRALIVRKHEQK